MSELVSGWLCLELTNSVDNYRLPEPYDFIPDYKSLIQFCQRTELATPTEGKLLLQLAESDPSGADTCLVRVKTLRKALYRIFSAIAASQDPPPADLELLNRMNAQVSAYSRILRTQDGFQWGWDSSAGNPDRLLWPLVRSAALLLTSPDLKRLRQCDGHNCTWLFLDRSKNRSRRWCTMDICGNRAKSRRHYARQRAS